MNKLREALEEIVAQHDEWGDIGLILVEKARQAIKAYDEQNTMKTAVKETLHELMKKPRDELVAEIEAMPGWVSEQSEWPSDDEIEAAKFNSAGQRVERGEGIDSLEDYDSGFDDCAQWLKKRMDGITEEVVMRKTENNLMPCPVCGTSHMQQVRRLHEMARCILLAYRDGAADIPKWLVRLAEEAGE